MERRRPFTGAWIETFSLSIRPRSAAVAPSQGRGLKREGFQNYRIVYTSPLHRGVD